MASLLLITASNTHNAVMTITAIMLSRQSIMCSWMPLSLMMTEKNAATTITVMMMTSQFCLFRIREDMGISQDSKEKLLTDMEDLTVSLLNLAITGRAVSHLHNGDLLYDLKGNLLVSIPSCIGHWWPAVWPQGKPAGEYSQSCQSLVRSSPIFTMVTCSLT